MMVIFPSFLSRLACLIKYGFKYFKVIHCQNGTGKSLRIFHVSSMKKSDCSRLIYYSSSLFLMGVVQGMAGTERSAFCGLGGNGEMMFSISMSLLVALALITASLLTLNNWQSYWLKDG